MHVGEVGQGTTHFASFPFMLTTPPIHLTNSKQIIPAILAFFPHQSQDLHHAQITVIHCVNTVDSRAGSMALPNQ